jgi:hypothetical protein
VPGSPRNRGSDPGRHAAADGISAVRQRCHHYLMTFSCPSPPRFLENPSLNLPRSAVANTPVVFVLSLLLGFVDSMPNEFVLTGFHIGDPALRVFIFDFGCRLLRFHYIRNRNCISVRTSVSSHPDPSLLFFPFTALVRYLSLVIF